MSNNDVTDDDCEPFRLTALSAGSCDQDVSDHTAYLELIQHINVDCSRLTKLLNGTLLHVLL